MEPALRIITLTGSCVSREGTNGGLLTMVAHEVSGWPGRISAIVGA